MLQVLCMRWNVIIGGQLLSKTGKGFHECDLEWASKDGTLAAIGVFMVPFVLLYIAYRILPPFEEKAEREASGEGGPIQTGLA